MSQKIVFHLDLIIKSAELELVVISGKLELVIISAQLSEAVGVGLLQGDRLVKVPEPTKIIPANFHKAPL